MLRQANRFCLRLWRDESGAALAVTVVAFLTVFMMVFSVFAVGETVRQRIEIQNAADAAAYSGAVAQADAISRVAAINRAMAWTYAQMGRMEMDAIVDRWLQLVVQRFFPDLNKVVALAALSNPVCNVPPATGAFDWYVGQNHGQRTHVQINRGPWVSIYEIMAERASAAGAGKSWMTLMPRIAMQRQIVLEMNQAEREIIGMIPEKVHEAVLETLRKNVSDTENDLLAGGARFAFALRQAEDPFANFAVLGNNADDEKIFLNYADLPPPDQYFGRGAQEGQWFVRSDSGTGIQRRYRQRANMLVASWSYRGANWQLTPLPAPVKIIQSYREVRGEEGWIDAFYETERCKPHRVKPEFFAEGGAIVVGVARRMNNPLRFLYDSEAQAGLFRPFTLDGGNRFMWGAAAAIAAHSVRNPAPSQGEYDPTYWSAQYKHWNLKYSDWDAVLLPLHRAWAQGEARSWTGETGGRILTDLRQGSWTPLYGAGGALGAQGAPRLMPGGGEVNWHAAEALILH